ncbi:MAG: DNA mismatch repair endonuclease MutL [Eubacterium sp.]|nr:DNA mismatch repair endonuclease MutL [Eubacterium sp.]
MIHVLDQHTIDKIAAGEVIERPASVVKELVENSIDAGASRITIEITDGGTSMIRVTDNGSGIEESDIRKAYLSHATSKLDNVDDLMNIVSLGFRGEALSTIAAVSKVEMVTKTHDALTGIKYEIHGGKEINYQEIGATDGTTIISRNLFFNTPARLKFLKSNMTEASYINDFVTHIALANPDVAIKLISGGKTIVDTNGDGRLRETIYSLFGKEITKGLLEVNYKGQIDDNDITIIGYIGKPYLSKGNRSFENYFINKRYIKSAVVNRAIEESYKTHIMQHKFPYTALFIDVPPFMVDVNVHPAKREFRFDNESALFKAVYHAVSDALSNKELIPESTYTEKLKKDSLSAQAPTPTPASTTFASSKTEPSVKSEQKSEQKSELKSELHSTQTVNEPKTVAKTLDYKMVEETREVRRPYNSTDSFSILESILPKEYRDKLKESDSQKSNMEDSKEESKEEHSKDEHEAIREPISTPLKKGTYQQEELTETRYLSEEAREKHKIIGLAFDTYWITEYDNCLYLMDQHAAHEKVNYETFMEEFRNRKILSQNIYPPMVINLSSREKNAIMNNIEYLNKTGFEVEDFGGNDVKLSAVPANLLGLGSRDVFMELAAYLADEVTGVTEDIFVHKIATMGCKAAVKGNQKITVQEVETLMDRLMSLKDPYTCPHGRPTIVKVTKDEMDRRFKRIVN